MPWQACSGCDTPIGLAHCISLSVHHLTLVDFHAWILTVEVGLANSWMVSRKCFALFVTLFWSFGEGFCKDFCAFRLVIYSDVVLSLLYFFHSRLFRTARARIFHVASDVPVKHKEHQSPTANCFLAYKFVWSPFVKILKRTINPILFCSIPNKHPEHSYGCQEKVVCKPQRIWWVITSAILAPKMGRSWAVSFSSRIPTKIVIKYPC